MNPDLFKQIIDQYNSQKFFKLFGEDYKRPLPNQLSEEFQPWYQKKNLYVSSIKKIDKLFFSNRLEKEIEDAFLFHAGLYRFLI